MTTSVYLIRHGAYDYRPSPQGDAASDFGLSTLGTRQALALRARLEAARDIRADAFYCSTLPRARDTAALIAPALGRSAMALPALREWDSGNDALGEDAFMAMWRALDHDTRRQHRFVAGFETIAEFTARVRDALAAVLREHEGQRIVLVVHGGVIEVAFSHFLGFGPGPFAGGYPAAGNASITLWQRSSRRDEWIQSFANDMHHLHGL